MRHHMLRASNVAIKLVASAFRVDAADNFTWNHGLTVAVGDIGVYVLSSDDDPTSGLMTIAGWTSLFDSDNEAPYARVFVRTMDGTGPDDSIASTNALGLTHTTMLLGVYRNAVEPTTLETDTDSSGMPNPPSVTGVVASDFVVVTAHLDNDEVTFTAPNNYTLVQTRSTGSSPDGSSTGLAHRTGVSGSQNPGVFGGGGDDFWYATTIILVNKNVS